MRKTDAAKRRSRVLQEVEGGRSVKEVCREHGITTGTYYSWKAKYGGMDVNEAPPLRERSVSFKGGAASAGTYLECSIVAEARFGEAGSEALDELIRAIDGDVVPVTLEQAQLAREAFRTFGKGRHAASLNFGDCFAYALAQSSGEPLLFKGNDFTRTAVRAVPWST